MIILQSVLTHIFNNFFYFDIQLLNYFSLKYATMLLVAAFL